MESLVMEDSAFWKGKRVLVTGHSGFKGGWLVVWLKRLGAQVTGISLPPITEPNLFSLARIDSVCNSHFCDIRKFDQFQELVWAADPEIIFHLAAQPLVRLSYCEPRETFQTNVMGSANLLEIVRQGGAVRTVVMITTDKVYRNNEWLWPYREKDELGGQDPYSAGKAASELIISSYRDSYFDERKVGVASARAGNVIGGGDWSSDRLFPDAMRAWQTGRTLEVRRPNAIRPWQHVLEPLWGYLRLAEKLWGDPKFAGAYNFGPPVGSEATVREVVEMARGMFDPADVRYACQDKGPHEANSLRLDPTKALLTLGVAPRWSLQKSIERTVDWYLHQKSGTDAELLCQQEIDAFEGPC